MRAAGEQLQERLVEAEGQLRRLDGQRRELMAEIASLRCALAEERAGATERQPAPEAAPVTHHSPEAEKIALFRSLFRGREDVYPKRFESMRTGKSGYQPHCANEWVGGLCA